MKLFLFSLLFSVILILTNCNSRMDADFLVTNARVYTVDTSFSIAEAFAVKSGKIIAIGTTSDIIKKFRSDSVLNLEGKTVYPGFIDAHCHFFGYGTSLRVADLRGTKTFEDVLLKVKDHADSHKTAWILGRGWDQNDWEVKEFPDKTKLDVLFPDIPVVLFRIDGHAALANQKALELAGIKPVSKVEGGSFILENGKLTGLLVDNAVDEVQKAIPQPSQDDIKQALLMAQENCFAVGLTSIQDAGLDKNVIETIKTLDAEGKLKMRIYAMLTPSEENFESYLYKGIYKTDFLNIRSVKLYADGALGSRGAKMISPYSDDPGNSGLWLTSPENIKRMAHLADSCGYQVNTHCIGDEANHEVLKIYSEILKTKNDKRWRIEHAQVVSLKDIPMFGNYNIVPSVQPTHATSDMSWANERIGIERMPGAYAYKSLLDQSGWIADGSDFPVENINPVYGFFAACSRKNQQMLPKDGFQISEALTREEALRAMTIWAAKAAFEESEKGSLEPGKFADFVVCDKDLMTEPEARILGIRVEQTFLGGVCVFLLK